MRTIDQIVNRQVKRWEIEAEIQAHAAHADDRGPLPPPRPFVTLSREAGAGGAQVAELLSGRLGWTLVDEQIVDYVAKEAHVQKRMAEALDQRTRGQIEWWLKSFMEHGRSLDEHDYLRLEARFLRTFIHHEPAVILGRGAHQVLYSERAHGLRVRVIAPLDARATRVAESQGLASKEAHRYVQHHDAERQAWLHATMGKNADDATFYDMAINTGDLSYEAGAQAILAAISAKQRQSAAP